jgi:hypothetical protein
MGLIFHDGTNPVLSGYASQKWDAITLLGTVGKFAKYNNETAIKAILNNPSSRVSYTYTTKFGRKNTDITLNFRDVMNHPGEPNAFVVKGVHQVGSGFIATPHMSIAYEGFIYHMELLDDSKKGLIIYNITRGQEYADPEGFSKV